MGAMITIQYDSNKVADEDIAKLVGGIRGLVAESIDDQDVFVYANKFTITAGAQPIEIFVQVNKHKVSDTAALIDDIAKRLSDWKQENSYTQVMNLNVLPVEWLSEVGI